MQSKTKQKIIFLHIPKTAGLSIISIIYSQYKANNISYINTKDIEWFEKLSDEKKEKINIVVGHQHFGLHQSFSGDTKYITLLRNPVSRVISMYHFIKRKPDNKYYKKITEENISLKEFVLNDEYFRPVYNAQTKLIAGFHTTALKEEVSEKTLITAKENIDKYFIVSGLTERFDESILLMKNELGWSYPTYIKKNVTKNKEKKSEISDEIKQLIIERNQYDIALYNYVTEKFDKTIDENKELMEKELKKFRLKNQRINSYLRFKQGTKETLRNFYYKIKND